MPSAAQRRMPPTKETNKQTYGRSISSDMAISAKVWHPATNLMPPSPPLSPTGVAPPFGSRPNSNSWSRQNSQNNGKYS